jgi:hypothetical protein
MHDQGCRDCDGGSFEQCWVCYGPVASLMPNWAVTLRVGIESSSTRCYPFTLREENPLTVTAAVLMDARSKSAGIVARRKQSERGSV